MTFASFFLQVLPASPAMAARGADKEREIEATTELRHMRMSRWTQINKSRTELAGFQGKSLALTRLITVDALINTLDRQASFCMLVQERISELVETAAEDPKAHQEYGAEMYGIIEVLKQDVLDLKAAVELFQDAEHVKRSLDKHNTDDIAIAWRDWHAEQSCITSHPVPRCPFSAGKVRCSYQLHGFADASNLAYGGVVYLRTTYQDSMVSVSLLLAKTKVAPISPPSTTPRLELCGALLLSRLLVVVAEALHIPPDCIYTWSDSTITLSWISCPPRNCNSFVSNRVAKITRNVPTEKWRHVSTTSNPTNIASRGIKLWLLTQSQLWWTGPHLLDTGLPEMRCLATVVDTTDEMVTHFSSYKRLVCVLAWIKRFLLNSSIREPEQRW